MHIYWQQNYKISAESARANNTYSSFCEITLKYFSFVSLYALCHPQQRDLLMKCHIGNRDILLSILNNY